MAGKPGPRLSLEPLYATLKVNDIDPEFIEGPRNAALRNAKFRGYLTLPVADDIACNVLKMHPIVIWGEEYMDAVHPDLGAFDEDEDVCNVIAFPVPVPAPALAVAA